MSAPENRTAQHSPWIDAILCAVILAAFCAGLYGLHLLAEYLVWAWPEHVGSMIGLLIAAACLVVLVGAALFFLYSEGLEQ